MKFFLAAFLVAAGCGRIGFGASPNAIDAGLADGAERDADRELDAAVAELVRCGALRPALETQPLVETLEPALFVDSRTLLARLAPGGMSIEATRADVTGSFGDSGPVTVIDRVMQDYAFVVVGDDVFAAGARAENGGGDRFLEICTNVGVAETCTRLTLFDAATGDELAGGIDGPTLANTDAGLRLAFNRGEEIFVATPRPGGLGVWDAAIIPFALFADDPALSRDGELLFVGVRDGDALSVYLMQWDSDEDTYIDPRSILDGQGAFSPAVGVEDGDELELFVSSDTRGISEPHVAPCVRTRP